MQNWLSVKSKLIISFFCCFLCVQGAVWADTATVPNERAALVLQQIELLKNRLKQAQNEVSNLQREKTSSLTTLSLNPANKQWRTQAELEIAVAKSNVDSISIELTESQQSVTHLEKEIQELQNQLNVVNIFGVKTAHNNVQNMQNLRAELIGEQHLLALEKTRVSNLLDLQRLADTALQLRRVKYNRIDMQLKSQTITRLRAQQVQSETDFQQEQSDWLKRLNSLYETLEKVKPTDKARYVKLQHDIFYANENVNYTYLQMLIVRYQDQLQQLKVSVVHTGSISFLNKVKDQTIVLAKQFARVKDLLKTRIKILEREEHIDQADVKQLNQLTDLYRNAIDTIINTEQSVILFRANLEQALQNEISARQGLPGFSEKAWLDLGEEIALVPTLTFQALKNVWSTLLQASSYVTYRLALYTVFLECIVILFLFMLSRWLKRWIATIADHEAGHIHPKRIVLQLLQRNLWSMALIGNIVAVLYFCGIPLQSVGAVIQVALVWLFFKVIIMTARLCLVETAHDRAGGDVRLYHRLKWTFWIGGIVTALTVFIHQLPIGYEIKDLSERLFLLCLFIASIFLLRSWDVVPGLILPHIDQRRPYLQKTVRIVGLLVPLLLLVNSICGLFGFVNLVLTMTWYESIFLCVLVSYLVIRGLLIDGMILISNIFIRHVNNGWLWTEAVLKPLDKIFRIALFLTAWTVLFLLFGWDQQSPVVERLTKLLHYPFITLLNAPITPVNVLELVVAISLLYWVARWTREFVYRSLLSRTEDSGLRNSLSVFSQYIVIAIGALICLRILGIDIKTLAVVASLFAVSIGFGLRDLANNFVCGFLLLIERPLRVGDTVNIGEYEGEVTHIGGRAVTVRTWDYMDVFIPNSDIFSKSFMNWTSKDHIVRTTAAIKINRHDSPPMVQAIILKVLADHKDVLKDPQPEALVKELSDSLIEFEVRYYINLRQVKSRVAVRSSVLMALWEAFEANGIKPPYPHHEIFVKGNMGSMKALEVLN